MRLAGISKDDRPHNILCTYLFGYKFIVVLGLKMTAMMMMMMMMVMVVMCQFLV